MSSFRNLNLRTHSNTRNLLSARISTEEQFKVYILNPTSRFIQQYVEFEFLRTHSNARDLAPKSTEEQYKVYIPKPSGRNLRHIVCPAAKSRESRRTVSWFFSTVDVHMAQHDDMGMGMGEHRRPNTIVTMNMQRPIPGTPLNTTESSCY